MLILRPVRADDADALFPLIYQSEITDTILWDGPDSLEEFRRDLAVRAEQVVKGKKHLFTMVETEKNKPIGSIDIRPEESGFRADIGLWIGKSYQGMGYGSRAVRWITAYGFDILKLDKIDAYVFMGNWASRRIFEKNGYIMEGIIRNAERKGGELVDVWAFGITRGDYLLFASPLDWLVHVCPRPDWELALQGGYYHPASLSQHGFIHCSRPDQVAGVIQAYYADLPDLLLLWIHSRLVMAEIRWESAESDIFPHVYGSLNTTAVVATTPLLPDADGLLQSVPPAPPGFN